MRHILRFSLTFAVVAAQLIVPSRAQAEPDRRWLPWLGCWQSAVERTAGNDERTCFVPASDGRNVERLLVSPGNPERTSASTRILIADGVERPAMYASCPGTLRTEWSSDERRFFTTLSSQCTDRPPLKASGIGFLLPGPAWIDIQVVESRSDEEVQVRRYRRTTVPEDLSNSLPEELLAQAEAASATLAGKRLTIDQVIDASAKTTAHGIEAALLEANMRFALDRAALRALDQAQVNENVIDLMVALTFPDHFAVDKPASSGGGFGFGYFGAPSTAYWDNSYSYDPFCDASYSYCPYYLSWITRAYALPYYASSVVIIGPGGPGYPVDPGGPLPTPPAVNPLAPARAINGQGYTHVRPSDGVAVSPVRGSSNSTGRVSPSSAGSGDGSSSSSSGSSSSGGGGNAGASGGGYSNSGGGGDSGRTAVPR